MHVERTVAITPERAGMALARFFERRGYRVIEALDVLWVEYRPPFFTSLPYHLRFDLDLDVLRAALRAAHVAAVRYPTRTQPGWPSGMFVCSPRAYSLEKIHGHHRQMTRSGLRRCELRRVHPDELLVWGMDLNLSTLQRQRRYDPEFMDPGRWKRLVATIRDCPEVTVSGAFVDGRLSAYSIECRDGDWLYLLYKMSRTEELVHRTNPALDYWLLSEAAKDPGLMGVHNSYLSSTEGSEGLHLYKVWMGYELVRHDFGIQFHPSLAPLLTNRVSVGLTSSLARLRPRSTRLELVAKVLEGARLSRGPAPKAS